jgi:hypothetical protein
MKKDIVIVSILFIAIIVLALWFSSSPSYVPYSSTIARGPAKYEGFSSLEYSSTKDNSVIDSPVSEYELNKDTVGSKSISGFSGYGVFTNPSSGPETVDIYSQAKGSLDGQGYGYYNSQGPLQLDDNMKKQLSTRGMNASGAPSIIGGASV